MVYIRILTKHWILQSVIADITSCKNSDERHFNTVGRSRVCLIRSQMLSKEEANMKFCKERCAGCKVNFRNRLSFTGHSRLGVKLRLFSRDIKDIFCRNANFKF